MARRPRRQLGEKLRPALTCPLCVDNKPEVVRWGRTTRFECKRCGLRFNLDLEQLAKILRTDECCDALGAAMGVSPYMLSEKPYLAADSDDVADLIEEVMPPVKHRPDTPMGKLEAAFGKG